MTMSNFRVNRSGKFWILGFVLVAAGLSGAGYWHYQSAVEDSRQTQFKTIAAVGTLKAEQVQEWRKNCLADTRRLLRGPYWFRAAPEFLSGVDGDNRAGLLRGRMQLEQNEGEYADVILFNSEQRPVLSASHAEADVASDSHSDETLRTVAAAMESKEIVLSDFYVQPDGKTYIDAAGAVRDAEGKAVGVLVLRSKPDAHLFPMIQSWPVPSESAETELIARRDGQAVILNSLRHRPGAGLSTSVSLSQKDVAAAQAGMGFTGSFQGLDYRGIDTLADIRAIPGSPWALVTKIDADEALAAARSHATFISFAVGSLVLLAAIATAFFSRKHRESLYRSLYESEHQQREAQEFFRTTLYSIDNGVITTDSLGRVRAVNAAAARLTGWTEQRAHGKPLEEVLQLIHPETRVPVTDGIERARNEREDTVIRTPGRAILVHHNGYESVIADTTAPIRDSAGAFVGFVVVFSDITDQCAAEDALRTSDEFHTSVLDSLAAHIVVLNTKGVIISVNGAWRRFVQEMGGNERKINPRGMNYMAVCDEAASDLYGSSGSAALAGIQDVLDGAIKSFSLEYSCLTSDGPRWFRMSVTPLRGTKAGVVVAHEEISTRKLTEEMLDDVCEDIAVSTGAPRTRLPRGR